MSADASRPTSLNPATDGSIVRDQGWGKCSVSWVVLGLIAAAIFALRLAAPENLLDQDQERPATYVLDVLKNGNWLCQRDLSGDITSKPPVWTWLSALASLAAGGVSVFSIYLPGALAALGTALLCFRVGRRYFGDWAALLGGISVMLSSAGIKAFGLARTDAVFMFTVAVTAFAAFAAWQRRKGWTWFWLIAAVSTLTKGPLGLLLGAMGLLASFWERKSGAASRIRGSHWLGVLIFLGITAGWLWLSWQVYGDAVIHKIIGKELMAQSLNVHRRIPGTYFYQPILFYIARAFPWSLIALYGFWRIWKYPASAGPGREFERFLFCWFFGGLFCFSIATHVRADLLWPIMPAGALIAGREAARWLEEFAPMKRRLIVGSAVVLALIGYGIYYLGPRAQQLVVQRTLDLKAMAAKLDAQGGARFPLTYVDAPAGLQVYLQTFRPAVSFDQAAALLRGPDPVFLAVRDLKKLEGARKPGDPAYFELLSTSADPKQDPTRIISNKPRPIPAESFALSSGRMVVRVVGAGLVCLSDTELRVQARQPNPTIRIENNGLQAKALRISLLGNGGREIRKEIVPPGSSRTISF